MTPFRRHLVEDQVHPSIREQVSRYHAATVDEVVEAIAAHAVVVVGMAQNPHVKRARRLLEQASVSFHYLEYGSYFAAWKPRLAIKMWAGWPTYPMVFVRGQLVGGASDLAKLIESGELPKLLG